jgi:hypothetical protein
LHPTWTPDEVRTALELGADERGLAGWDIYYGAGRLNVRRTLESLGPASVAILSPDEDTGVRGDTTVEVIGSAMSPFIRWWRLFIGYGDTPEEWIPLTDTMSQGRVMDHLATFRTDTLPDTLLQVRLLLMQTNNRQTERRIRLHVDRTAPLLAGSDSLDIRNVWRFEERAVSITLRTDDLTRAVAWIRRSDQPNSPYRPIDHEPERTGLTHNHFLLLSSQDMDPNVPYDLYIELRNTTGATTLVGSIDAPLRITRERDAFPLTTMKIKRDTIGTNIYTRSLPYGYTLNEFAQFYGDGQECVAINRFQGGDFGPMAIYSFNGKQFVLRDTTEDIWIPRGIGDSDGDGRREILGQSRSMMKVFEQAAPVGSPLARVKYVDTTSHNVWAGTFHDFDGDGRSELIARTDNNNEEPAYYYIARWNGSSYQEVTRLENPTKPARGSQRNMFGPPESVITDFDGDGRDDILIGDDDGDFVVYTQQSDGSFRVRWTDENDGEGGSEMIASGDIDGDGRQEIIVGFRSPLVANGYRDNEYEAPFWTVKVVSLMPDGGAEVRWSERIAYVRPTNPFRSGMIAGDLDGKSGDELVVSVFPNLYVFHWDATGSTLRPLWWGSGVVNNRPLLHDFDRDGRAELGVGTPDGFLFFQIDPNSHAPQAPSGVHGWALNDSTAFLQWNPVEGATGYNVYRGVVQPGNSQIPLRTIVTTTETMLIDTGLGLPEGRLAARTNYIYLVTTIDPTATPQESELSVRADVYTHTPARIVAAYATSGRAIRVSVSASPAQMLYRPGAFDVHSASSGKPAIVNSIVASNDTTVLVTLRDDHFGDTLLIRPTSLFRDAWNTPADTSSVASVVMRSGETPGERFIATRAYVTGGDTIAVEFNMPVDQSDAEDISNYRLEPNGSLLRAFMLSENPRLVYLVVSPDFPLGPLGKNYTVTINDLRSADGRVINDGAGSVVGFTIIADNLDGVFAYPQPFSLSQDETLTFAGLTSRVSIYIFTPDGTSVRAIEAREGNGGARWDGRDNNGHPVPTGIYLYRVISTGTDGKDLETSAPKKIAVVR